MKRMQGAPSGAGGTHNPTVAEYVTAMRSSPVFGPQVRGIKHLAARPARSGKLRPPLPAPLTAALAATGINRLYSHQVEAIDHSRAGKDIVIATPTASGKTLAYLLPFVEAWLADRNRRAVLIFPLKALARDQKRFIDEFTALLPEKTRPTIAVYDGDTTAWFRRKIRDNPPDILITNPEMLHLSLVGRHDLWPGFWATVHQVVIDEAHTCRGVMGSHMAWVLRRMIRLTGNSRTLRFTLCSATIANPKELALALTGRPAVLIKGDGAPAGRRTVALVDPADSAAACACDLLAAAVARGLRTIVYTQSRKMAELISLWSGLRCRKMAHRIVPYRAGYTAKDRRDIERRLADGDLLGVVSTSALELGIDIGGLDICIMAGFPGSMISFWQRSGRAGRRGNDSLTIFVAHEDALDRFFLNNPKRLFDGDVEAAHANPHNPHIMGQHLQAAAAERPLSLDEKLLADQAVRSVALQLVQKGTLLQGDNSTTLHATRTYPHREIDLRGSGSRLVILQEGSKEPLGEVDGVRALRECHPGAVYLHQGKTCLVKQLDLDNSRVVVANKQLPYYTRPYAGKTTEILDVLFEKEIAAARVSYGRLRITDQVTGFQKLWKNRKNKNTVESLDLPPTIFETEGFWLAIPGRIEQDATARRYHFMGGIHAMEHILIAMLPLVTLCDRGDIGGISIPFHPQTGGAAVFVYDGVAGGAGICRQAARRIERLLTTARTALAGCDCDSGCPACVHSPKCGAGNRPLDKNCALFLIDSLTTDTRRRTPARVATTTGCTTKEKQRPLSSGTPGDAGGLQEKKTVIPENYGVFDLETQRSAQEVGGWRNCHRMRVSVGVLYRSTDDTFHLFHEHQMQEMIAVMRQLDLVVGFNSRRFDYRVLSAYADEPLDGLPTLDILEKIQKQLGYRLSLNRLAEQTLGMQKSGNGLLALQWFREGRMDLLADYCTQDVRVTRDLFLFGLHRGYLLFQNKAGNVVRCPVDFS